jgi:hypothetical protein
MKIMNHLEAIRLKASEKYLLGELSAELRDQYEDHYFGCMECAQDIRAGAAFVDNARDIWSARTDGDEVVQVHSKKARGSSWWGAMLRPAFGVPVLAALLLVAGYQNVVTIPRLKTAVSQSQTPHVLSSFYLTKDRSRSAAGALPIAVTPNKPFSLVIDIPADLPPQPQFASYLCEIQTEAGAAEFSLSVSPEDAKRAVELLIPAGRLASGVHVLVVYGLGSPGNPASARMGVADFKFSLSNTK